MSTPVGVSVDRRTELAPSPPTQSPLGDGAKLVDRGASAPALDALTGLRFVAALGVVLFHAVPWRFPSAHGAPRQLVESGFVGVSLFFVLSGFILAYNYLDPGRGALRRSTREFWWARVARIYPVYLLSLAFAAPEVAHMLRAPASPGDVHGATASLALAPVLLQSWWPTAACRWNCPGWSLSVEAFFYLLFPFVGVRLARQRKRALLAFGAVVWALGLVPPAIYLATAPWNGGAGPTHLESGFWLNALKFHPIPHLPEFLIGVVTGLVYLRVRERDARATLPPTSARRIRLLAGAATLAAGAALALTSWLPFLLVRDGVLAPVWALAIYALALRDGVIAQVLASRPLVRLGEASYALYLIHSPLDGYLRKLTALVPGYRLTSGWDLGVYLFVAIVLSLAILRWVEEPARRAIRRRTVGGRPGTAPARSGSATG